MSTKIQYVSAPAGSGKTFQVGKLAATLVASENRKVIISQPTKKLIIQTANDIRKVNPAASVHLIYSHGDGAPVTPRIERHMANAEPSKGQILLITHEALKRLPNAHRVHWDLFVDEIPPVFECIPLKMVKTHQHLTDHLVLEDLAAGISKVKIANQNSRNITALKHNESEDQLLGYFGEIATHLLDESRTVMVETAGYNSLLNGTKHKGEVNFFSVLDASFVEDYASVTFLGANATETELFILWESLCDVRFAPHPILSKGLRYQEHQNGSRLTIHYLFEHEWSKVRSLRVSEQTGLTLLEGIGDFISRHFAGQRFLWVANKGADMEMFDQNDRLPPVSHGLNKPHFMNCHAVASTIALVHNNASAKFLGMLGLTEHQIRTIICYQAEYQAILRCSLRDPKATAPVTIIVPSRASAEWIAGKFDGCSISKLETGLDWETQIGGRPKVAKPMTPAERTRKHRAKKKLQQQAAA